MSLRILESVQHFLGPPNFFSMDPTYPQGGSFVIKQNFLKPIVGPVIALQSFGPAKKDYIKWVPANFLTSSIFGNFFSGSDRPQGCGHFDVQLDLGRPLFEQVGLYKLVQEGQNPSEKFILLSLWGPIYISYFMKKKIFLLKKLTL